MTADRVGMEGNQATFLVGYLSPYIELSLATCCETSSIVLASDVIDFLPFYCVLILFQ